VPVGALTRGAERNCFTLAAPLSGVRALIQYPDINPVAFSIWRVQVHWYGLMYVLGFIAAWLGLRWRSRKPGSPVAPSEVEDLVFYGAVGVFVGGRIGYMLLYDLDGLIGNPLSLLYVWQGGMSFHGGLLGVLLAMGLYAWRKRLSYFTVTDQIAPWIPPGLCFGRLGNFINGELWGRVTDVPWAIIYQGEPRHPSQLYEAALEGILLFIVLLLFSARPRPRMAVSGLFLLLYGLFRIAIEFIRVPDGGIYLAWGWLTRGQVYSAPMVIAGIVLIVLAYRHPRMEAATAQ
jgi:phosphatidylglycerol---prolipoprotein diacylglyceryl transferase